MNQPIRAALLLLSGIAIGISLSVASYSPQNQRQAQQGLVLLQEVIETVETYYVEQFSREQLVNAAIDGIFRKLDSHSAFLDESHAKDLQRNNRGEYYGFGFEITQTPQALIINNTFPGTPAALADLQPGDRILACDHLAISSDNSSQILAALRQSAQQKQPVELKIRRGDEAFALMLQPAHIRLHSVQATLLADHIGYLKITHFQQDTAQEARKWLTYWQQQQIQGLVLDLRNNPGGLLEQAVAIADMLLNDGVIVATQGRYPHANETFYASAETLLPQIPMVVIINKASASASEILTAALHDHQRATVIGETSFGKGTVQSLIPNLYEPGSMLKLTTARYTTPNGDLLDTQGIEPDITVTQDHAGGSTLIASDTRKSDDQQDYQFNVAIRWLETRNHN
ncbi:S41 family peptidase [Shewanella sp. YIC-542]|uniref:S41 family peptidase n=1 Tax=Shewanella mytili TaxID=3377111 RepID=UPI00398F662B